MSFDFDVAVSAPFRMQPGLRRLQDGARHLTPLPPGSRHQREKWAVLSRFAPQALLVRDGFDAAPALEALAAHAALEHPGTLQWNGHRATATQLGVAVERGEVIELAPGRFGTGDELSRCLYGLPTAWRLAGLLSLAFAEDFAIVDAGDGSIPWLAVALPSHGAPEDKVGRHFSQVHEPVADNGLLLAASDRLTALVTAPQRWERFVWTVTSHPRLHAHPARTDPLRWPSPADAATFETAAWWRSERQTFIPVPAQRQAIFTILVDVQPLTLAVADPHRARRLHDAIASMSPAVLDYRGLAAVRNALLDWLAARAGG